MAFLEALTTLVPAVTGIFSKIADARAARKAGTALAMPVPASVPALPQVSLPAVPVTGAAPNLSGGIAAAAGRLVGKAVGNAIGLNAPLASGLPEFLKQYALDPAQLRSYLRAPKGYVIVHDAAGNAYALLKQVARMYHLWKPAAKPPISATDYKHFKRNKIIEKRLKKIAGPALRKHTTRQIDTRGKK